MHLLANVINDKTYHLNTLTLVISGLGTHISTALEFSSLDILLMLFKWTVGLKNFAMATRSRMDKHNLNCWEHFDKCLLTIMTLTTVCYWSSCRQWNNTQSPTFEIKIQASRSCFCSRLYYKVFTARLRCSTGYAKKVDVLDFG